MEQLKFYLSAVLVGILSSVVLELAGKAIQKKQLVVNEDRRNIISENHIQDCILPNNRGKSIDVIVENLKAHNIDPDFTVDF